MADRVFIERVPTALIEAIVQADTYVLRVGADIVTAEPVVRDIIHLEDREGLLSHIDTLVVARFDNYDRRAGPWSPLLKVKFQFEDVELEDLFPLENEIFSGEGDGGAAGTSRPLPGSVYNTGPNAGIVAGPNATNLDAGTLVFDRRFLSGAGQTEDNPELT